MFDFLKLKSRVKSKNILSPCESLISQFANQAGHKWIVADHTLLRAFSILFTSISEQDATLLLHRSPLLFLSTNGHLSCTITHTEKFNLILIFPDLLKLLKSASPTSAAAVLAHELGHIINNHSQRDMAEIDKQLEADDFAAKLGFSKELVRILEEYDHSCECKARIEYLIRREAVPQLTL